MKKITVITVTYNAENFIENTIISVLKQDYKNLEYIIIDGKSTDDTVKIINKYKEHIAYFISEEDLGIYNAMNKGIEIATGKFINFMNAGDTFTKENVVSSIFKKLENKTDIIAGDINYNNEGNKMVLRKTQGLDDIYNGFFSFCCHQAVFVKTYILKEYMFDIQYKIAADFEFILRCYKNKKQFQFINLIVANYLNGGESKKHKTIARIEELFILTKYLDDINNIYSLKPFLRLSENNNNRSMLLAYLFNNFKSSINKLNLSKKKFVLYGYGNVGEIVYEKFKNNIISIVDKEFTTLKVVNNQVKDPKTLLDIDFDYILISVLGREELIKEYLIKELKINKNKILVLN